MRRNSDLQTRFPAFYRHDIINWRRQQLGLELRDIERETGITYTSVRNACLGIAKNTAVFPLSRFLGLDWKALHDFDLPKSKFHLAVSGNGGSLSAG